VARDGSMKTHCTLFISVVTHRALHGVIDVIRYIGARNELSYLKMQYIEQVLPLCNVKFKTCCPSLTIYMQRAAHACVCVYVSLCLLCLCLFLYHSLQLLFLFVALIRSMFRYAGEGRDQTDVQLDPVRTRRCTAADRTRPDQHVSRPVFGVRPVADCCHWCRCRLDGIRTSTVRLLDNADRHVDHGSHQNGVVDEQRTSPGVGVVNIVVVVVNYQRRRPTHAVRRR